MSPTSTDPADAATPAPSRLVVPQDAWDKLVAQIHEDREEAAHDAHAELAALRASLEQAEARIAGQLQTIRAQSERCLRAERRTDEQRQAAADRERQLLARIERLVCALKALAQEVPS